MSRHICLWAIFAILLAAPLLQADSVVLDFEGFPDGTVITTQYSGVDFSNALVLTAGISLNELEFPPHSGTNVVSDNGGAMMISFASPVLSFGGYFTYSVPLTLTAFSNMDSVLGSATSAFSNNEALSGDAGSQPNEFLELTSSRGISRVTILGSPAGGSFTLDDATFTPTPEPCTFVLVLAGGITLIRLRKRAVF